MDITHVSTVLRRRGRWEATDLGFAMVRAWWRPVFGAWLATLGLACALLASATWWHPAAMLVGLWWIKPLLDRVLLFVFSNALFTDPPDWRRSVGQIPSLIRHQWFAALTWRRFDPWRSFHLPVVQLEELTGKKRRARQRILRQQKHAGGWLTLTCLIMEFCIQLALAALIVMLFPELAGSAPLQTLILGAKSAESYIPLIAIYLISIAIVEPFYVAAGFAIYLNRRTWLEAWDLEIGFRQIAQRFSATAALAFAAFLIVAAGFPTPAPAESSPSSVPTSRYCQSLERQLAELDRSPDPVSQVLAKVLRGSDFPACAIRYRWVFPADLPAREPARPFDIATVIELALWLVFAGACGGFIVWLIRRSPPAKSGNARPPAPPGAVTKKPGVAEQFGTDSSNTAATLWSAMRQREAVGFLYRATLQRIGELYLFEFDPSSTEGDCLLAGQRAMPTSDPKLHYFCRLTHFWQRAAYAHTLPTDQCFADLCAEWRAHFLRRDEI